MNEQTFPELVEWKSATATIYRTKNRERIRFEVRHYDLNGVQQRFTFETYAAAKKFANAAVHNLADSRSQFVTLRGQEAYEYSRSKELLAGTRLNFLDLVTTAIEAEKLLQGRASVMDAVRAFAKTTPLKEPNITAAEAVNRFLAFKKAEGEVGDLYLRDLRIRLRKFAESFGGPLSAITPGQLNEYVFKQGNSSRTRKNVRTTINTLYAYARNEGFVAKDHPGVPQPGKKRVERCNVQVFTPGEMQKLLAVAKPEVAVPLALTAFAGIRAAEVKRLDWERINLAEGHIEIIAKIAKTGIRRLAPVPDNLKAWLTKFFHCGGKVCIFSNLWLQYEKVARAAGVKWKRNALRHGFASYRVADIKDIPRTAFEAGNSPQVIQRDYLKVVSERQAKQWFSIYPDPLPQVVAFGRSGDPNTPVENASPEEAVA
jgi:integrase